MYRNIRLSLLVLICALSTAVSAEQSDQFEKGKMKSKVCATCHGVTGISVEPVYPNLQGQHAQYLVLALKAYKAKQRTGGLADIMQQMAAPLTEQDMKDIAFYFSTVTSSSTPDTSNK
jgi:cytochrome c553